MTDLGGLTENTLHLGVLEGTCCKERRGGVFFGSSLNMRTKFFCPQ